MTAPIDPKNLERIVTEVAREVLGARRRSLPLPARDRIAIGSDHSGYRLKVQLARYLREDLGYEIEDCGTHGEAPVDYPDIARAVAERIRSGVCSRGVLIDAAGIGSTMAANKVRGIRCALCHDEATARNGRLHNDANVLALGARVVNAGYARTIVRTFLRTEFEGGRHARRVEKIMRLEEET
jgi:ribose 5-phosphate isomerase B